MIFSRRVLFAFSGMLLFFAFSGRFFPVHAQTLQDKVNRVVSESRADVGVAISTLSGDERATFQADKPFPMLSVYKFPVVLAFLHEVDRGHFGLDDTLWIKPSYLPPGTHSPLRDKYPGGQVHVSLREIVSDTLVLSDNNGCDILLRLLGGPERVDKYLEQAGITGMTIGATEAEMHRNRENVFKNRATPDSSNQLLRLFYEKKLLKPETQAFLWKLMQDSLTGPGRLRAPLPAGTVLIHKTGTGDPSATDGITVNDVGILLLPDGKPVFISVFITRSPDAILETEKMIAALSQVAWAHFVPR